MTDTESEDYSEVSSTYEKEYVERYIHYEWPIGPPPAPTHTPWVQQSLLDFLKLEDLETARCISKYNGITFYFDFKRRAHKPIMHAVKYNPFFGGGGGGVVHG